ncbi:MAG TPA: exosortase system-associated protein, TIGR04073 family, partial [Nitrospiraceae bacterium]|nr:exosortase system-associated protein, TIGR04073 family [Nitrospiraceae bacterium]
MSRVVLGFTIALMVFSADPALAGDQPVLLGIGTKLLRGLINVGTGWLEMPKQIYQVARDKGVLLGLTRGPIEGMGMFAARTVGGAYEILTFPLPLPPRYQPMLYPDYVWQAEPPEIPA